MKKLLICLVAMLLLTTAALAEVTVEKTTQHPKSIYLSTATNCYYARVDGGYQLFDMHGNALSAVYDYLTAKAGGLYYEYDGEGLNYIGLLDKNGQVICTPTYGKFVTYEDNWALGYVLESTTAENGDFKDSDNNQYNVVRTDVFYDGRVIGSWGRDEYVPGYSEGAADDYFFVKQTSESGFYIDKYFNKYQVNGYMYTSTEYDYDYKTKTVTHNRTLQKAFCADSTLTEEQVTATVWYDDNTYSMLDLKGNVIKDKVNYDYVRVYENYISIRLNKLYGVMDLEGNVIVEPAYAELATDLYANGSTQAALTTEGYIHFLDLQGNVTAKAEYPLTSSDYKGFSYNSPFVVVKNMGKVIVITATHGELSVTYEDFYQARTNHQVLRVQKDGLWGAIDTAGNTVIPFIHRAAPDISDDGTFVVGIDTDRQYHSYILSGGKAEQQETETQVSGEEGAAPVLADGSWTCSCGATNTGKFCGFCGQKKPEATPTPEPTAAPTPAADGAWDCTCGSHNTGKFCPECGQKRPEATPVPEPQCKNCGYKPGETAPKFCPECGTKF